MRKNAALLLFLLASTACMAQHDSTYYEYAVYIHKKVYYQDGTTEDLKPTVLFKYEGEISFKSFAGRVLDIINYMQKKGYELHTALGTELNNSDIIFRKKKTVKK